MFGENWFVVVPDTAAAAFAAKMLRRYAVKMIAHHSGRPWLLGDWPDGRLVTLEAGPARLALSGRHPRDYGAIAARLRRVRDVSEIERVVSGVPGSFHVLASVGGRVRARGSASGARRVCHARVAGVTVAADRADVLAALTGAGVDDQVLALRLMIPALPYPLEERSVWRGVRGVPPDECLVMEPDGSARTSVWWRPPRAVLSLEEGARAVREALVGAVGTCTAGLGTISADLSGGLDSSAVCFLAAPGPARLVTARWRSADPGNDDDRWAGRAAAALPGVEHVVVDRDGGPPWFAGLGGVPDLDYDPGGGLGGGLGGFGGGGGLGSVTDEPCAWVRERAKLIDIAGRMARGGVRLYICGGGSDELFTPKPPHLYDLLRRHPLTALRRIGRYRADRRVPWRGLLRSLADRRSFGEWLAAAANRLDRVPAAYADQCVSWQPYPRIPPWASADAVWAAASLLRQAAADEPDPLAQERAVHLTLQCVRARGTVVNQIDQLLGCLGIGYAAPYTDDAVVEAALSVRARERTGAAPGVTPLLAEAMRGIVPGHILRRTAAGGHGANTFASLRRHRGELLGLFAGSLLAGRGLIDIDRARSALAGSSGPAHLDSLPPTLGCEVWLRSLPTAGPGTARTTSAVPSLVSADGQR
jgi:asparagine synthase (glutamine-hydrolysing)